MRSEALDITIESRQGEIWLTLSGPFHNEQIPSMREKFTSLQEDGNRQFVVDLEHISAMDDAVVSFFLDLLNQVRGKSGDMRFIFKNETVYHAFAPYYNLFSIFPDIASVTSGGFLGWIRQRGKFLFRKTGIRISRAVAIFLVFVLCGWFLTLAFIIHIQNRQIDEQQSRLHELTEWKQRSVIELNELNERLRPMEQLGILKPDTLHNK